LPSTADRPHGRRSRFPSPVLLRTRSRRQWKKTRTSRIWKPTRRAKQRARPHPGKLVKKVVKQAKDADGADGGGGGDADAGAKARNMRRSAKSGHTTIRSNITPIMPRAATRKTGPRRP